MNPTISVIIPTYNRYQMLEHTLPSYLESSMVTELWLVDDGSKQDNWEKIQVFSRLDPRVHCIQNEKNLGAPASRNRGISKAGGDLLLLSEDDLELGENHLEILVDHLYSNDADIIAGRRLWMRIGESKSEALLRCSNSKKPVVNYRLLDHNSNVISGSDQTVPLLDATMLMRREVACKVKYYEPFGGPSTWREESDFQFQALEHGFKLVFCPHVTCFHHARRSASYGTHRIKNDLVYLYRIYSNNRLYLDRHRDYLQKNYPSSLFLNSVLVTSILYGVDKAAWLIRTEVYRWYLSRGEKAFDWK